MVTHIPSSVAASKSTESTPTPDLPIILSLGKFSITSLVVCGTVPTNKTSASFAAAISSFSFEHGITEDSIPEASNTSSIVLGGPLLPGEFTVITTLYGIINSLCDLLYSVKKTVYRT